jgi:hypothetical protein
MRRIQEHLTYANVTSTLALVFAMAGGAYAVAVPRNSVGGAQLKRNAVTSAKVKDRSLLITDFAVAQRAALRGPKGDPGPEGPAGEDGADGDPGPPGSFDSVVPRLGQVATVADNTPALVFAYCNADEIAVGGGGTFAGGDSGQSIINTNYPLTALRDAAGNPTGNAFASGPNSADMWAVRGFNKSGHALSLNAYALCVRRP